MLREVNTHLDTTTVPHFTAPLGIRRHLPLFVFLPGLDGTGMYISSQLEGLKAHYDVRCLCIPVADRKGYDALAKVAADNIAHERRERGAGANLSLSPPISIRTRFQALKGEPTLPLELLGLRHRRYSALSAWHISDADCMWWRDTLD